MYSLSSRNKTNSRSWSQMKDGLNDKSIIRIVADILFINLNLMNYI